MQYIKYKLNGGYAPITNNTNFISGMSKIDDEWYIGYYEGTQEQANEFMLLFPEHAMSLLEVDTLIETLWNVLPATRGSTYDGIEYLNDIIIDENGHINAIYRHTLKGRLTDDEIHLATMKAILGYITNNNDSNNIFEIAKECILAGGCDIITLQKLFDTGLISLEQYDELEMLL